MSYEATDPEEQDAPEPEDVPDDGPDFDRCGQPDQEEGQEKPKAAVSFGIKVKATKNGHP